MAGVFGPGDPEENLPQFSPRRGQLSLEKLSVELAIPNANDSEVRDEDVEQYLRTNASSGEQEAVFLLGQFLFENERFSEARDIFEKLCAEDVRAKYQLAVMYFDGLGGKQDGETAIKYMKEISKSNHPNSETLIASALYCIGWAYFGGYGVLYSEDTAKNYWIEAARDGDPSGSIMAQSTLGMYYSRCNEPCYDLKKAHFWHQEATSNGSIESQGALGVMYEYGLGVRQDRRSALYCYKRAADKGNVYASGRLAFLYYTGKFFRKAVEVCERILMNDDVDAVVEKTSCVKGYVNKGLAMVSFLYARCLHVGRGIAKDKERSIKYYNKALKHDYDVVYWMQGLTAQGVI